MSVFYSLDLGVAMFLMLITFLQRAECCIIQFVPKENDDERGDYGIKAFESKRDKSLDCTCGTIPGPISPANFDFPWEVLISHTTTNADSGTNKVCRGTIINDKIILTTASCVLKKTLAEVMDDPWVPIFFPQECYAQPSELKVWMPYHGMSGTDGKEVSEIYTNPLFLNKRIIYNKVDYDIALLTLKEPLVFGGTSESVPVCLPQSLKIRDDKDLEGLETFLTRWYLNDPNSITSITEGHPHFQSFIYPRMRCRLNNENNWISDRFLCTYAPRFTGKLYYNEVGGAILVEKDGQYSQVGIHSWRTYFPMLYSKHPVSLASNVIGFLDKIEEFSKNAKWCKNDWNGFPEKGEDYKSSEVNEKFQDTSTLPWIKMTSELRNVRKSCKCGLSNNFVSNNGRIQGGVDADPYKYGWQVQLIIFQPVKKTFTRQLCGGSIINNRIIITAAHCVYKSLAPLDGLLKPENLRVYLHRYKGPIDRDDKSRLAKVEAIIPHPGFSATGLIENDIALIVLRRPICFKCLEGKVSPLCLPETNENIQLDGRMDAKILGWGRMNVLEKASHAEKLQELSVTIISRQECIKIMELKPDTTNFLPQIRDDDKKICAGNFKPAWDYMDPAQGDSGGGLFLPITPGSNTMVHVGVASFITMGPAAVEKKDPKTVVLYTKTQPYVDFVDYYSFIVDAIWCSR